MISHVWNVHIINYTDFWIIFRLSSDTQHSKSPSAVYTHLQWQIQSLSQDSDSVWGWGPFWIIPSLIPGIHIHITPTFPSVCSPWSFCDDLLRHFYNLFPSCFLLSSFCLSQTSGQNSSFTVPNIFLIPKPLFNIDPHTHGRLQSLFLAHWCFGVLKAQSLTLILIPSGGQGLKTKG